MKSFLFGAGSLLGGAILDHGELSGVVAFGNRGRQPPGVSRGINLNDEDAVRELFVAERPDLVINCSGVCDIEKCETSPEFAHAVNVEGTRNLLAYLPAGVRLVHCSSDHVFSGDTGPYDEESPPDPISVYGRTRVEAEGLVLARPGTLVVRPGLWIGTSRSGRVGHLDWLRYRHRRSLPMTVIAEEERSAVWAEDAARRVVALAMSDVGGIRHLTSTEVVARPRLARFLNDHYRIGAELVVGSRSQRGVPHLGRVELRTRYADLLAQPLPSVLLATGG